MSRYSHLSDSELRAQIKTLEAKGFTGRTCQELHERNCEQTGRLSDPDLLFRIRSRAAVGKPIGKLVAAARRRKLDF